LVAQWSRRPPGRWSFRAAGPASTRQTDTSSFPTREERFWLVNLWYSAAPIGSRLGPPPAGTKTNSAPPIPPRAEQVGRSEFRARGFGRMKAHGEVPNAQHCRRVVFVGRVNLRRDDSAGVEIDGVFRLVGQMVPSFILAILASMRTRSSEDGVSIPLSPAIRFSIYRLPAHDRPERGIPPSSRHRRRSARRPPGRARRSAPAPSRTPPRGPLAAAGFASSTGRSGPAPVLSSADAETP
jgi:hypothetical protein